MLTINHLTDNEYDLDHVLTIQDKRALIVENVNGNYSYICLMVEMFSYTNTTVRTVLNGWGGVKLFKL